MPTLTEIRLLVDTNNTPKINSLFDYSANFNQTATQSIDADRHWGLRFSDAIESKYLTHTTTYTIRCIKNM